MTQARPGSRSSPARPAASAAPLPRLAADGFAVACVDLRAGTRPGSRGSCPGPRLRRRRARRGVGAPGRGPDPRRPRGALAAGQRRRVFSIQRLVDLDEAEWDRIIDTNLKGPFLTCREFLPAMIAAGDGCIVNIASTAGVRGGRRRAAYCASKGGLVLLTRSLAIDHGRDGVRVNCVCPA